MQNNKVGNLPKRMDEHTFGENSFVQCTLGMVVTSMFTQHQEIQKHMLGGFAKLWMIVIITKCCQSASIGSCKLP